MFVVVGERINTSRKAVDAAVEARDAAYIHGDVQRQQQAGATYIDVNAGSRIGREAEDLCWLVDVVQEAVDLPLCLDSPDPQVLFEAFRRTRRPPMINSISLEKSRLEPMLAFLKGRACRIVALCVSDAGMPRSASETVARAGELIAALEAAGMAREAIFVDPLVQPVAADITKGAMVLEAVSGIRAAFADVRIMCGLSNISFGLPKRRLVNRHFLGLLMAAGADGAILDPLDKATMTAVRINEMLLGRDDYCLNFIRAVRTGALA